MFLSFLHVLENLLDKLYSAVTADRKPSKH